MLLLDSHSQCTVDYNCNCQFTFLETFCFSYCLSMTVCFFIIQVVTAVETNQKRTKFFDVDEDDIAYDTADAIDTADPVRYCGLRVDESMIRMLMNNPCHPGDDFVFPKSSKDNRQCPRSCFCRVLPDNSKTKRTWLSYSIAADRLYCIDCMLFGGPISSNIVWTSTGYNTWSNAVRDVQLHESSEMHKTAESNRLMFVMKRRIDHVAASMRNAVVDGNRRAAYVAVKALRWLSMEMVAIRGHNSYDGKFVSLYTLLADFDPAARAYLDRLDSIRGRNAGRKPEVNILSPRNVRKLLIVMRDMVISKIVTAMKLQGACSIIADGTQDESKLEACCLILRYIELNHEGVPKPVERTIGIFTTGDTGGQSLSVEMTKCLETAGVDMKSIIGQSYDGASNMSGRYNGVRAKIEELQPMALYVWCKGHRLNLVIQNVLACCREVRNALGTVQELYVFFVGHRRHAVLLEMQSTATRKRTLKRVADTTRSWRSAEDGVNTVLECFDFVVEALEKLAAESSDSKTVSSAEGLLKKLSTFEFIATLHVLQLIFKTTGPASRILQSVATDLAISTQIVSNSIVILQQYRSDSLLTLNKVMTNAKTFASARGIQTKLPAPRTRRVPRQPDENAADEPIIDEYERFRVEVLNVCLDTVIAQLSDRFAADKFPIFVQMQSFAPWKLMTEENVNSESIKELCDFYGLDPVLVARELAEFRVAYRSVHSLVDVSDLQPKQGIQRFQPERTSGREVNIGLAADDGSCLVDVNTHAAVPVPATPAVDIAPTGDVHDDDIVNLSQNDDDNDAAADDSEDDGNVSVSDFVHWTDYSFVKPLRVIYQLSAYPMLTTLYKILSSIAVTSCSAERTLSRVRIIKNRLRSTMQDDWFSSLTLLACERDISDSLRVEDIVDTFAGLSAPLRRHLV